MLRYSVRPSRLPVGTLSKEDDSVIRRAFGGAPEMACRVEGERLVSLHRKSDHWFLCDCRPDAERSPTLFLSDAGHIQREEKGRGTEHDESCPFFRNDTRQKKFVQRYKRRSSDKRKFRLVIKFKNDDDKIPSTSTVTKHSDRPALAQVLFEVLQEAGLNNIPVEEPFCGGKPALEQTRQRIKEAAKSFYLTDGQRVVDWLATSVGEYKDLKKRLEAARQKWSRPHGLFIEVFYKIENNGLFLKDAEHPFATITGKLSVFGEKEAKSRPPYLVIGLLAQPYKDADHVELIRAYAHPCVAWDRWLPVDSNHERDTLDILVDCRNWLVDDKRKLPVTINKPLFDIGPDIGDIPREICKPDFVLNIHSEAALNPVIVIETMGYDTDNYRKRKERMFLLFSQIGNRTDVPIIEHDFCLKGVNDEDRDRQFFKKVAAIALKKREGV
jgi:hypothetical protein